MLLVGVAIGFAVMLLVLVGRRWSRRTRAPSEALPDDIPAGGRRSETQEPTPELLAAWIQFLKEDLAGAANALNNRLNVIAHLADEVATTSPAREHQVGARQILTEVQRAAKITHGLLRRVTALAPSEVPASYLELERAPTVRPAHLLIVEADQANRTVMTKLFSKLGHRVTAVSDGFEAFDLVQRTRVDCIVCELHLPSVGGRTLFEQIAELIPPLSRRFVFATGDFTRPSSRDFLEHSGCPIVAKPYSVEELLAAVSRVLSSVPVAGDG